MPIYAYRCESCGFQKDFLRKLSDPPLSDCPECGKPTLQKQVTAAGFQLKGSGWYVTDFREGGSNTGDKATGKPAVDSSAGAAAPASGGSTDSGGSAAAPAAGTASTTSTAAPAPVAATASSATPSAKSDA